MTLAVNTYNAVTKLWTCATDGLLQTSETTAIVVQVFYVGDSASDDLVIQDGKGNSAIILKVDAAFAPSPVRLPMEEGGRKFDGLKIQTIDSGTAYIYLCKS